MSGNNQSDRFGGVARLYGEAGLRALGQSHVCVVGVGGVGSWTVEALARSGIGALTLVDLDEVCVTNVNRQLPALDGGFGRFKVEELAKRVKLIAPDCAVHARAEFFTSTTCEAILSDGFEFVVDAIDNIRNKVLLIAGCRHRGIPVITSGAAGGRRDGTRVQVVDLAKSVQDPLLSKVRAILRKEHGFPQDGKTMGVPCVFSPEPPVYPKPDGTVCASRAEAGVQEGSMKLNCKWGFGAATFVTGAFGFAAAGEVVQRLAGADSA
ncbi:MAG: tRNA threonylcarbamoyladenosine dehydratase [Verrucomicrobiota bacterium]|jgi:tRNA A37 threonylcarbamoyladenosine dehydratase|nr:tRNA threonylcarbamoyladenosine dehydratase [Verrucomicrobiota bacterium]